MKIGTKIFGQLIVDSRFVKNTDLKTAISAKRQGLKTALHMEGIEIYQLGEERFLDWKPEVDNTQIRQNFTLILSKSLTKDRIYELVNMVQAQPLKFKQP